MTSHATYDDVQQARAVRDDEKCKKLAKRPHYEDVVEPTPACILKYKPFGLSADDTYRAVILETYPLNIGVTTGPTNVEMV